MGISKQAGKPPPEAPRIGQLQGSNITLIAFVLQYWLVFAALFIIGRYFVVVSSNRVPSNNALLIFVITFASVVLSGGIVLISYSCYKESIRKSKNLYTNGIARKAVVIYIGLDTKSFGSEIRYSWIVKWQYNINEETDTDISPLSSMLAAEIEDEFWILVDPSDLLVACRWALFREGVVENADTVDRIIYYKARPRDPRMMASISTV